MYRSIRTTVWLEDVGDLEISWEPGRQPQLRIVHTEDEWEDSAHLEDVAREMAKYHSLGWEAKSILEGQVRDHDAECGCLTCNWLGCWVGLDDD
jgi:hypothetical protein